jgi:hypothetical protein
MGGGGRGWTGEPVGCGGRTAMWTRLRRGGCCATYRGRASGWSTHVDPRSRRAGSAAYQGTAPAGGLAGAVGVRLRGGRAGPPSAVAGGRQPLRDEGAALIGDAVIRVRCLSCVVHCMSTAGSMHGRVQATQCTISALVGRPRATRFGRRSDDRGGVRTATLRKHVPRHEYIPAHSDRPNRPMRREIACRDHNRRPDVRLRYVLAQGRAAPCRIGPGGTRDRGPE